MLIGAFCLLFLVCSLVNAQLDAIRSLPFYSPCTFPVASSGNPIQNREHYKICGKKRHLNFICDLHFQLNQQSVFAITKAFEKHRVVLEGQDGKPRFEIIIGLIGCLENSYYTISVKYLASPVSSSFVNEDNSEFGCLFRTPCLHVTPEIVDKFVHNSKTFTKVSLISTWVHGNLICLIGFWCPILPAKVLFRIRLHNVDQIECICNAFLFERSATSVELLN